MTSFFRGLTKRPSNDEDKPPSPTASETPDAVKESLAEQESSDDVSSPPADTPTSPRSSTPPAATAEAPSENSAAEARTQKEKEMQIKAEDEPEEDPVRTELESHVRQRDASISALEKARLEKKVELTELERLLEDERLQQMKEALTHKIESERIKRQTTHAEERLQALEHDMQDKAAIHEYANLIKGVAPKGGVDSQYVVKLQAQLQKAVKKMESTTTHMKELEDNSTEVVDTLSKDISVLVEERCSTELELRKQMEVLVEQKKDMQNEYENRILENLKTLQALRAKAASQVTIEELEEELEETEAALEELHRVQEAQEKTIKQLNKSLEEEAVM
jgi:DNA repair exonuclease SbcCD ATPase subunit